MSALEKTDQQTGWQAVCTLSDLIANSGICVLLEGQQIAIFYLPEEDISLFAVSNWDPLGKANVISRGILGDIDGKLVVASPLYKQHFELATGACIEEPEEALISYPICLQDEQVMIQL